MNVYLIMFSEVAQIIVQLKKTPTSIVMSKNRRITLASLGEYSVERQLLNCILG